MSPPRACGSLGSLPVSFQIAKRILAYPQKAFVQPNEMGHIDAVSIFPSYFLFLLHGLSDLSAGLLYCGSGLPQWVPGTWRVRVSEAGLRNRYGYE